MVGREHLPKTTLSIVFDPYLLFLLQSPNSTQLQLQLHDKMSIQNR